MKIGSFFFMHFVHFQLNGFTLECSTDIMTNVDKGHKNIFACLFSVHNTITLSCHEQVWLMRLRFEKYSYHHWEIGEASLETWPY